MFHGLKYNQSQNKTLKLIKYKAKTINFLSLELPLSQQKIFSDTNSRLNILAFLTILLTL